MRQTEIEHDHWRGDQAIRESIWKTRENESAKAATEAEIRLQVARNRGKELELEQLREQVKLQQELNRANSLS